MFRRSLNLRNFLVLIAGAFITASIFFSNSLAKRIAAQERLKVEQYIEALRDLYNINKTDTRLASKIIEENAKDIPLIQTNERDSIISYNAEASLTNDPVALRRRLQEFKDINLPVIWTNPLNADQKNYTWYGESDLLKEIRLFPLLQLMVAVLFIVIVIIAITTKNKSTQNQVWAGMAKETAHQLGTPISSLQGWLELLRETPGAETISEEMAKDVERLKLVSDRFGKIGATPVLEEHSVTLQVKQMMEYIRRRATDKVAFTLQAPDEDVTALINPPLFDWVIENILKNALDAMDGKGSIETTIKNATAEVIIEIKDSGKGISRKDLPNVFKPGFTTKKRGWGLGLSLSKRIIERYHKGELYVSRSEPGKGTTFRIVLKR